MADEPYRDATDALRARLDAMEKSGAEARARVTELERQLELATGSRPPRGRALAPLVVVFLVAVAIGLGLWTMATRATHESGVAQRILSLRDAQLEILRVRDHHVCSLHFRHRDIDGSYGRLEPLCDTRIQCETTLYEGLARCADHQHIVDDQGPDDDGDGRIAIDLLAGTAVVDGERFSF